MHCLYGETRYKCSKGHTNYGYTQAMAWMPSIPTKDRQNKHGTLVPTTNKLFSSVAAILGCAVSYSPSTSSISAATNECPAELRLSVSGYGRSNKENTYSSSALRHRIQTTPYTYLKTIDDIVESPVASNHRQTGYNTYGDFERNRPICRLGRSRSGLHTGRTK